MRRAVLFSAIPLSLILGGLRPKNVIAELATATWCGWCHDAYAGLEVMKDKYPPPDLSCVRYYASSGNYGTSETDARISYYGVTGFPTCIFNGTEKVVGGGTLTATGERYDPVISSLLAQGTPFWINVELNISGNQATVRVKVKLYEDYSESAPKLRVALIEDNVSGVHTNVTRRIVTVGDVNISKEGEEQVFEENFDIDPEWDKDNLHAVAFIQTSTKEILQVGSSYPRLDYHHRLIARKRIDRISPSETFSTFLYLTNVGSKADDYTITLDDSGLPAGWTANLNNGTQVSLEPDEEAEFELRINPNGNTGQGDVKVRVFSNSSGEEKELLFRVITNDVDCNIVDDDGGEDFEKYFTQALDSIGKTYGVWDLTMGEFHLDNLSSNKTPVLIWSCGWSFPSLTKEDRNLLKDYLEHGGRLFITGQDIGWDLCDTDSENATYDAKQFYHKYLHANYIADDADNTSILGVPGDPITDGMRFNIAGGDGANNQEYPSIIEPYDDAASTILTYSTGDGAAIKAETDAYRVVYLAFGYEAIDNFFSRKKLLEKSLAWLGEPSLGMSENLLRDNTLTLKIINLNQGILTLLYSIPYLKGQLNIYDVVGRKIKGKFISGPQGKIDFNIKELPPGCYFIHLKSGESRTISKIILMQ